MTDMTTTNSDQELEAGGVTLEPQHTAVRVEETGPEDLQTEIQSPEDTESHAVSVPNQAEITADSQRSRLENMLHNSDDDAESDEDAAQNSQMEEEEQVRIRSLIMPELLHNSEDYVFSDDGTNNTEEPSQETEGVRQF